MFLHNSGCKFSIGFLNRYITFLNKQSNYYESYCCLYRGHFDRALSALFEYLDPTESQLKIICKYNNSYNSLKVLLDRNYKMSESIFMEVLNQNQKRYRSDNLNIIKCSKHKNYECTINHLNIVCEKDYLKLLNIFEKNKNIKVNINVYNYV